MNVEDMLENKVENVKYIEGCMIEIKFSNGYKFRIMSNEGYLDVVTVEKNGKIIGTL